MLPLLLVEVAVDQGDILDMAFAVPRQEGAHQRSHVIELLGGGGLGNNGHQ
jgi:hypothetical protein